LLKTLKILLFILMTLALIGGAGYFGFASSARPTPTAQPAPKTVSVTTCDVEQTVTAPGILVNTSETYVKMPVTGKLAQVYVKPGDMVDAGQVLADLDAVAKTEAKAKLLEARSELETARTNRTSMDYPRATDEYLAKLNKEIKTARENVALMADLYKNSDDPALKTQALANLTAAQEKKDELIAKYNWYVGKPSENDKDAADTKLALLQAKFDAAKALLESLEVRAPMAGVVLEVKAATGQTFNADENLFKLIDPKALEVKANVTEEDYPLLAPGMEAELYFDARADVIVKGKVERIVPKRIEGSSPLYNIYISLSEVPQGLADGMTTDAAVTIAKRAGVLCLPRTVVRASGENKVVLKVWNDVKTDTREVTVGLRGDAFVEILSGLKEGDQVVTK
jgi:RND family efflux transporter MFP subunit